MPTTDGLVGSAVYYSVAMELPHEAVIVRDRLLSIHVRGIILGVATPLELPEQNWKNHGPGAVLAQRAFVRWS